MSKGTLFIFSAPSGSGKTTIVQALLKKYDHLEFSVSATTRSPRPGEIHGDHYYFLEVEEFKEKIRNGEFAEWEEVYPGVFYGTLISEIESVLETGNSVVFDIDVVGGLNLKKLYRDQAVSIFVQPPDLETLKNRLIQRGTESEADLQKRLGKAAQELEFADKFDHIIINNNLDAAVGKAEELVRK